MSASDFVITGCECVDLNRYERVEDNYSSSLTICSNPKWNPPNHIIIGMWRHHDYQNIVLDQAGAEALIAKFQEHFGLNKG